MDFRVDLYLHFQGEALDALKYYEGLFEVERNFLLLNHEIEGYPTKPGQENWVAHGSFRVGPVQINLGDEEDAARAGSRVAVMLRHEDIGTVKALTDKFLTTGATAIMPFTKTFYSPGYAVVRDKFGITWHLYTESDD